MDIVEWLRDAEPELYGKRCKEAADEIERLREQERKMTAHALDRMEEIERLREALTWIERHPVEESKQWEVAVNEIKRLARSTLQQKESE